MDYENLPKIEQFFDEFIDCVEHDHERANNLVHHIAKFVHITQLVVHAMAMDDIEQVISDTIEEDELKEALRNNPQGGGEA